MAPARRRAFPLAGNLARRFQVGQQSANPFAAHAGTRAFDVSEAEVAQFLTNGREHEFRLCAARRFDLADALLVSARTRTESRGAHARREYPDTDPLWRLRLVHGDVTAMGAESR